MTKEFLSRQVRKGKPVRPASVFYPQAAAKRRKRPLSPQSSALSPQPLSQSFFFPRLFLLLALATHSLIGFAALPEPLRRPLAEAGISENSVALWVAPAGGGEAAVLHNPDRLMSPASVMKLLTSHAALDLLGPGYTWKTRAWLAVPLKDGLLAGNVLIAGSGDPDLTWDRLGQWLRDWRSRGLREIRGDILVDRRLIPERAEPDFDAAPHRAYNAKPSAFLVNFGALSVQLRPAPGGRLEAVPGVPVSPLRLINRAKLSDGPCNGWRDGLVGRFQPEGQGFVLTLDGRLPASCGEKSFNLAVDDSLRWAGAVIRAQWQELGGRWQGELREASLPEGLAEPFSTWESPALPELLRDMDKWSNNVMARQVFLALGDEGQGSLSLAQTQKRLLPWMGSQGLDATQWVFENGSGLSRRERTTAAQLGALLRAAWKSPRMPEFLAAQPTIGVDGTMRKRLPGTPVAGRGYVKTGSLDGVKSAAGYLLDAQGRWQAFVLLINHPRADYAEPTVDALLNWVWGR